MRTNIRRNRVLGAAAAAIALVTLSACGQIYPSSEPAQGPANGIKSSVNEVVVGFAQQQLQAPYFAAMQVRAEEIAKEQGIVFNSAPGTCLAPCRHLLARGGPCLSL